MTAAGALAAGGIGRGRPRELDYDLSHSEDPLASTPHKCGEAPPVLQGHVVWEAASRGGRETRLSATVASKTARIIVIPKISRVLYLQRLTNLDIENRSPQ